MSGFLNDELAQLQQQKHLEELKEKLARLKQQEEHILGQEDCAVNFAEIEDTVGSKMKGVVRESSLSTIASQSLNQDLSDNDTYAYINQINNAKFTTLKKLYSYDKKEDEEPKRYSPSLFNNSSFQENASFQQNQTFRQNQFSAKINNDELYCPRAIMKNNSEHVVSDTSTPTTSRLLAETQMSPKPPAAPVPAPNLLNISSVPSNHEISFADTSMTSQPPTKYAKITKISQLHSPNMNANNNNNNHSLNEADAENNKSASLSSMEGSHEGFNESSGQLSKSSTSCSSGIASNVVHETSCIKINLEDANRVSAFSPVRKFSYQASNVGAFQVQVDKVPIENSFSHSSTLYVP